MSSEREKKGNIFYEQEQGVMEEQDFSELSCHTVPEISGGGVLGLGEVVLLVSACTIHTYFCRSCV